MIKGKRYTDLESVVGKNPYIDIVINTIEEYMDLEYDRNRVLENLKNKRLFNKLQNSKERYIMLYPNKHDIGYLIEEDVIKKSEFLNIYWINPYWFWKVEFKNNLMI